jgi:hypothetical protein
VGRAVATSRRTGDPVRIRGIKIRLEGIEVRIGVLVVLPGRWEFGEITPKLLDHDPATVVSVRGRARAEWRPFLLDIAISAEMLHRWIAANAATLGVDPRTLVTSATAIGLRRHDPGDAMHGVPSVGAPTGTIGDFQFSPGAGGEAEIRAHTRPPRELTAIFTQLPADLLIDGGSVLDLRSSEAAVAGMEVGSAMDRLRSAVELSQWPEARQCIRARCKTCEFRVLGDPESGFARCWGAEVDHQRDHILQLDRLTDAQLSATVERGGFSASVASLDKAEVSPRQSWVLGAMQGREIQCDEELRAWALQRSGASRDGREPARTPPSGPSHFLRASVAQIAVSAWPGATPYEAVPFQFSLHRLPSDFSSLSERMTMPGFVRCDLADPRRDFVRALRDQLGEAGPVYHWHHLESSLIRSLSAGIAASGTQPGDRELLDFLSRLAGTDGSPGRLVDLLMIAKGFRPPEVNWSFSLRRFIRYAWRFRRISSAFQPGNGAPADQAVYADTVDPWRSLPTIPVLALRNSIVRPEVVSAADPWATQQLWLECRLADGRDPREAHKVLRAWGQLESASVLMAYYFLVHVAPVIAEQPVDRTVRVFVSSTFRDFREERNLLKRRVEPVLNRRSLDRAVQAMIVDLRWGITDEQAGNGMTLPVCLREVTRCRPYFIGLLGHRYGWIPPVGAYPADLVEREPWLREHAGGSSMTELEIRHGIFGDVRGDARFYFRSHAFAAGKGEDFESSDSVERRKLAELKQAIRDRGFRVTEDYPDPPTFASNVTEDIWSRIDRAFPADLLGDAALPGWSAQRAHAIRLWSTFVEDPDEIRAVRRLLVDARVQRVTIVGPTGCGKSALFAAVLRPYAESDRPTLIQHFVGVGDTPAEAVAVARRIVTTAAARIGIAPSDPRLADPCSELAMRTLAAEARDRDTRLMIGIDGLDRIVGAEQVEWLRSRLPEGVMLVVTALSQRAAPGGERSRGGSKVVRVRPIDANRARMVVERVLRENGRSLTSGQLDQIAQHPCARSPGFLRTVIDELIACASHEELPSRIRECLATKSMKALCGVVLRRLEAEIGAEAVREIFRKLLEAPDGMRESALVDAAGGKHAELSALRLQLGHALVDAGGRITLPPGDFAKAAQRILGKKPR